MPEISGKPTSLLNQYVWWGVRHDGKGPGKVRDDVFWPNWYNDSGPEYNFAKDAAVVQASWKISYELPAWSTNLNWQRQQEAARKHRFEIATVARDTLMLNLVLAATGRRLRSVTWARTSTIFEGSPLYVYCRDGSVHVRQHWDPEDANDRLGVAVEGVPSEIAI